MLMKLALATSVVSVLCASVVASAESKVCLVKDKIVVEPRAKLDYKAPDDGGPPTSVTFCAQPNACKTFPLAGLRGLPPDPPRVYMNKEGTLGAFRWLANDERGWHDSLRIYNLTTGKQLENLTQWTAGGWVNLTKDRFVVDGKIYDPAGKLVGTLDKSKPYTVIALDGTVAVASDGTGRFEIVELATAKTRFKGSWPHIKKGNSDALDVGVSSDGKWVWVTVAGASASLDLAARTTSLGVPPAPCP